MDRRAWMRAGATALAAAAVASDPTLGLTQPVSVRLSLNENAFGCSPRVGKAIRNSLGTLNRYTERAADVLTEQIAAQESVPPDQVLLGSVLAPLGTQLGLTGGELIYSVPGFTDLVAAGERSGGKAIGVPLNSQLANDLPAIASQVSERTRVVFIVNPHNPSGTVTSPEILTAFVRDVSQRTLVVIDEAYLEYTDDFKARTLVSLVREGRNVMVFRTFDKIYGLAALQFGYAVAPAGLVQTLRQRGVGAAHALNGLAVVAASAALGDTRFVEETRSKVAGERERWNLALHRLGLKRTQSDASFVFFQTDRTQKEVAAALLKRGIDIGRGYPPLDNWVRISIGTPRDNTLAIDALRDILLEGKVVHGPHATDAK
jgi:histidinol-phosphate aminotransferase